MNKPKILIVEDQDLIADNVTKILKENNFEVSDIAKTASEGEKAINRNRPDLILMDITLEGEVDGVQAAKDIKSKHKIPIIFLTAHKGGLNFNKAKKIGADGYLIKDTSLNEQLLLQIDFVLSRYKMEKALVESEEKFRKIAKAANEGIILIDSEGKVSFWNDVASRIFGYTSEEIKGKNLHYLVAPEKYMKDYYLAYKRFRETGEGPVVGDNRELEGLRKDGSIVPLLVSVQSLEIDGSWNAVGVVRDISDLKEKEAKIQAQMKDLEESKKALEKRSGEIEALNEQLKESETGLREMNAAKDKFFSIIAHDLKSPLGAFRSTTELLHQDYDDFGDEDRREFIELMNNSAKQLFELLENLLEWARSQTGRISYEPELIDVTELFVSNADIFKQAAEEKGVEIVIVPEKRVFTFADPNMINGVIRNLIANAIKFSYPDGKIKLDARDSGAEEVVISCTDTGVGMSEEDKNKLFRIDVNHTTPGTNNEKGTGLGLVVCKEFVEKNGGRIWLETKKDVGSSFFFTLKKKG